MKRLSPSNLPIPSFLGTNIMLCVDVALQVVRCDMYVVIKNRASLQKIDPCNMSRKHDTVRVTPPSKRLGMSLVRE